MSGKCTVQSKAVELLHGSFAGLAKGLNRAQASNLTLNKVQNYPGKKPCSSWCETGFNPSRFWKKLQTEIMEQKNSSGDCLVN